MYGLFDNKYITTFKDLLKYGYDKLGHHVDLKNKLM